MVKQLQLQLQPVRLSPPQPRSKKLHRTIVRLLLLEKRKQAASWNPGTVH